MKIFKLITLILLPFLVGVSFGYFINYNSSKHSIKISTPEVSSVFNISPKDLLSCETLGYTNFYNSLATTSGETVFANLTKSTDQKSTNKYVFGIIPNDKLSVSPSDPYFSRKSAEFTILVNNDEILAAQRATPKFYSDNPTVESIFINKRSGLAIFGSASLDVFHRPSGGVDYLFCQ